MIPSMFWCSGMEPEPQTQVEKLIQSFQFPEYVDQVEYLAEDIPDTYSRSVGHTIIGYLPKNNLTQPERLKIIHQLLIVWNATLVHYKIPFWITHGTLLGSWRQSGIIPWDPDAGINSYFLLIV
jgi:hypothetical protein